MFEENENDNNAYTYYSNSRCVAQGLIKTITRWFLELINAFGEFNTSQHDFFFQTNSLTMSTMALQVKAKTGKKILNS